MTTPAHTDYDPTKPSGASTPAVVVTDIVANMKGLRDFSLLGFVPGFAQTRTNGAGTADKPQFIAWINTTLTIGFRWNITWSGFNPATVQPEWNNIDPTNSAGSWTAIGSPVVMTFDGNGNITSGTVAGGWTTVLFEIWAKAGYSFANLVAHVAATGTAVHGLGTAAVANLASMLITGTSKFNGLAIGDSSPPDVDSTRVREAFHDYGAIATTVALELDKYAAFAFTAPSSATSFSITLSGVPAAGKFQAWNLEIINGGRTGGATITMPTNTKEIGGSGSMPIAASLETAGRNIYAFYTRDGGTRYEWTHLGKGG